MEKLNKLISDFLLKYEIDNMEEFIFESNLSKIISSHPKNTKYKAHKIYVPLKKSLQYSYDFLKTLSPRYADIFNENKEKIIFENLKNARYDEAYSDYIYETNERIIYIPYSDTINDAFAITHEIVHVATMDIDLSFTNNLFCEVMTLCSEMLLIDYLSKRGIKELNINIEVELETLRQLNNVSVFQTRLVNEYLENGYITSIRYIDLISDFEEFDRESINYHIQKNLEDHEFDLLFLNRYIVGYTLASYLYDKMSSIQELVDLNDSVNKYSILDFLDYLNLEYKDSEYLDLTEKSYQDIKKSYVKMLKRI